MYITLSEEDLKRKDIFVNKIRKLFNKKTYHLLQKRRFSIRRTIFLHCLCTFAARFFFVKVALFNSPKLLKQTGLLI